MVSAEKMKEWEEKFANAIRDKDNIKIDELLDESDNYTIAYTLPSLPDIINNMSAVQYDSNLSDEENWKNFFNVRQSCSVDILRQALSKYRENLKYIIALLPKWEDNGKRFDDTFKEICNTPILLSIIFHFELSGIYIIQLLHTSLKFEPDLSYIDKNSAYQRQYKYHNRFSNKVKQILNFNFDNWSGKKDDDKWKLLNICYWVDQVFNIKTKIKNRGLLINILEDNINSKYWQIPDEFLTQMENSKNFSIKEMNQHRMKYIIARTLIFQNEKTERHLINDLSDTFLICDDVVNFIININWHNILWLFYYIHEKGISDAKILNKKFDILVQERKKLRKNIMSFEIEIEELQKVHNIFTEFIWKLILCEHICSKQIFKEAGLKFLKPYEIGTAQRNAIKNIIHNKNKINIVDWDNFYRQCKDELKCIFVDCDERELKNIWEVATKCILFVFPDEFNFDRNRNRLSHVKDGIGKKIDSISDYSKFQIEIILLIVLMEIAKIGDKVKINEFFPITKYNDKAENFTVRQVMDNISNYAFDSVIAWLQTMSRLRLCSYYSSDTSEIYENEMLISFIYKKIFDSHLYMEQSIELLKEYWNKLLDSGISTLKIFFKE